MKHIRAFGMFWWDFIVGDDWRAAAGVLIAIALTAVLAHNAIPAWWLMPLAVTAVLLLTLRKATR